MKRKLLIFLSLVALTLATAGAAVRFVNLANPSPAPPYTTWASAATTIQDAVDAAEAGDEVVVTNGVYATGGSVADGSRLTNRVTITKPLTLRSANGPEVTVIRGYQVPGTTNGDGAVRCVYLRSAATLDGFTLTNGATLSGQVSDSDGAGGGVWGSDETVTVTNCNILGNSARQGGGASGSFYAEGFILPRSPIVLKNCVVAGNSALSGGGAVVSTLGNCRLVGNSALAGGGASYSTLENCRIIGNVAGLWGGGVYVGKLTDCILTGNYAYGGGGVIEGQMENCTVAGNSAFDGGGVGSSYLNNCIVYFNTDVVGDPNYFRSGIASSCTTPLPPGLGNINADPRFRDSAHGDFRLLSCSPCIDSGAFTFAAKDIAGNPRPLDGNSDAEAGFDMGAYEFNPKAIVTIGPIRITGQIIANDGRLQVSVAPSRLTDYYILDRGDSPTNVITPVALHLGSDCALPELVDPIPVANYGKAFYRVRAIPLDQPLDSDGDGIDDVYELRQPWILSPLNAGDAAQDYDQDGQSNLQEYRIGGDLAGGTGQALAADGHRLLGLKTNGSLWVFEAATGQLEPVGGGSNYAAVYTGGFAVAPRDGWVAGSSSYSRHTLALKADGTLWSWGENVAGQLGIGAITLSQTNPVRVGIASDWRTVAAGIDFSVALKADGSLWTWGGNLAGQLGNGTTDQGTTVPMQVGVERDWVAVDASKWDGLDAYALARKVDGTLWSWGLGLGELGLEGIWSTNAPTRIGTNSNWRSFSCGAFHVVACTTEGTLWTWGESTGGSRTRIGADTNWVAVAAGVNVSAALKSNGTLWSWSVGESPRQVSIDTDWGPPL